MQATHNLDEHFWNERYRNGQTGWNLHQPSPPLVQYMHTLPEEAKQWHILFPGSGESPDPFFWYAQGFKNVYALDISPLAKEHFLKKHPTFPEHQFLSSDFFTLEANRWDLIIEQTFFCALPPSMRLNYVQQMQEILKPNGLLAGLWFHRHFEHEGPPYGGDADEYFCLFSPYFEKIIAEPCLHSASPRAGTEYWMQWKKPTSHTLI